MALVDWIVATAVLGGSAGMVAARAWMAWRDYRIQRRALELLVRSVADRETPRKASIR